MLTPTKQKVKSRCGFATPTFNNNLDNNNFGFNKPICKFDNNKLDNDLFNELIMKKIKKTDNIQQPTMQSVGSKLDTLVLFFNILRN